MLGAWDWSFVGLRAFVAVCAAASIASVVVIEFSDRRANQIFNAGKTPDNASQLKE